MRSNKLWFFLCIVFMSQGALAALSRADLASLPPFCNPDYRKINKWTKGLALHHYCAGLDHLNKYYTAKSQDKRNWHYSLGMSEFNYVLKHPDPVRNPLVGNQYYSRGKLYSLGGKDIAAVKDWYKAIEVNPKLRRAYLDLARYLAAHDQKDQALKIITTGLRHLPKSKSLQKRYVKLGGKLPYPEPVKP